MRTKNTKGFFQIRFFHAGRSSNINEPANSSDLTNYFSPYEKPTIVVEATSNNQHSRARQFSYHNKTKGVIVRCRN